MHGRLLTAAATALGAALTVATLVSVPPTAAADTQDFTDPADSNHAPDLRRITVEHSRRLTVVARHTGTELSQFTRIHYWIDTRPLNPGPEFYALVLPNTDGAVLQRTGTWRQHRGPVVGCRGFRAHADFIANDALRLSVPRRCLGAPPRVRVAIRVQEVYASKQFSDWAAGFRQFMPWVHR